MDSSIASVAGEVRAALARKNIRKGAVAKALGISMSAMSSKINGKVAFSIPELVVVASLAGVDAAEFFSDVPQRVTTPGRSAYTDVA